MEPSDWCNKEVMLWAWQLQLSPALTAFLSYQQITGYQLLQYHQIRLQQEDLAALGLATQEIDLLLEATDVLRYHGPALEVVQQIEVSREALPLLNRSNSKESQPHKGKFKSFFATLFGSKPTETQRIQHAASLERMSYSVLIDEHARDQMKMLVPEHDLSGVSLCSPEWSELLESYQHFGIKQSIAIPRFQKLKEQWRIAE
jgi:hypothetical protein